jgi:hypothetical protein
MKLRCRIAIEIGLLALGLTVLLCPSLQWCAKGWCSGESFYQRRPTSWWNNEIEQSYVLSASEYFPAFWTRHPDPAPRHWLLELLSWQRRTNPVGPPALLDGDEAAVSVLAELFQRGIPKGRAVAIQGLRKLGSKAKPATPALSVMLSDADLEIRSTARWLLGEIDPDAAANASVSDQH